MVPPLPPPWAPHPPCGGHHPQPGQAGALSSDQDRLAADGRDVCRRSSVIGRGHGQALNAFSDADRRSGAGYLAGEDGRVFFQGNGTAREVK